MLGGLLDLNELTVSDIMIHRTKMNALDIDMPAGHWSSRRRKPAYPAAAVAEDPENIVGVLHIKICAGPARGGQRRNRAGADHDAALVRAGYH